MFTRIVNVRRAVTTALIFSFMLTSVGVCLANTASLGRPDASSAGQQVVTLPAYGSINRDRYYEVSATHGTRRSINADRYYEDSAYTHRAIIGDRYYEETK